MPHLQNATVADYFSRNAASTWTAADSSTAHTWKHHFTDGAINDSQFQISANYSKGRITPTGAADYCAVVNNGYIGVGGGEVLCKMTAMPMTVGNGVQGVIINRHTPGAFIEVGLTQANVFRIRQWDGSTRANSVVTQLAFTNWTRPTNSEFIWIRAQSINGAIKAKIWVAGSAEPAAWTLTANATAGRFLNSNWALGGVYIYAGANAGFTVTYDKFFVYGMGAQAKATPAHPVVESFADPVFRGLGLANTGQEWKGEGSFRAEWPILDTASGSHVLQTDSGYHDAAYQRVYVSQNRVSSQYIGNPIINSSQKIFFRFENPGQRLFLFARAPQSDNSWGSYDPTYNNIPHLNISEGSFLLVSNGSSTRSYGGTIALKNNYYAKMVVKNGRVWGKLWDWSQPEPPEFSLSLPLLGTTLSNGVGGYGLWQYNSGVTLVHDYEAHNTIERTFRYGGLSASASGSVVPISGRVRRRSAVGGATKAVASFGFVRARLGDLSAGSEASVLSFEPKAKFRSKLTVAATGATTFRNRRGKRSSIRASALGSTLFRYKRVIRRTLRADAKASTSFAPMVIPNVKLEFDAIASFSCAEVVGKNGKVKAESFGGTTFTNRRLIRRTLRADASARTKFQIPGMHLEELFITAQADRSFEPNVNFAGRFDTLAEGTMSATAQVYEIIVSSVGSVINTGSLFTPAMRFFGVKHVEDSTSHSTFTPVRAIDYTLQADGVTTMTIEWPDFDLTYANVIRERSSFIHYACTKMTRTTMVIEYKHRGTVSRTSTTYFIARDTDRKPILYGYARSIWEDGITIVHVTDEFENPFIEQIKSEFRIVEKDVVG